MKHVLIIVSLLCSMFVVLQTAYAVIEAVEFDSPDQEQRYKKLIDDLRCLVCQNQNLSGSDAPLAKDLREITASMIKQGASDAEIKEFMRSRYGDFVLYEPPFNPTTAFLWLGPFILLLLVSIGLIMNIRRRQRDERFRPSHANNDAKQVKVRNLLRNSPSLNGDKDSSGNND